MANKLPIWSISRYSGGVNSGISPLDLPDGVAAFGLNVTCRGGYFHPRPPFMRQILDFGGDAALQLAVEKGFFQGATLKPYKPDFGPSSHIAQISGRLFKFTPAIVARTWIVTEITIPGDPNDATTGQVWMYQFEKWLGIWDGTPKLPIFYDNVLARRSYGPSQVLGTITAIVPATPPLDTNGAPSGNATLTLTAPYTGPFDVPVLFNGAFYQPIANPAPSPTYNVTLTNVSDNSGLPHPAGVDVSVIPGQIGRLARATTAAPGSFPPGTVIAGEAFNLSNLIPTIPNNTQILITNSANIQYQFKVLSSAPSVPFPNQRAYSVQVVTGFLGPNSFPIGSMVQLAGAVPPATIIGQTTGSFVPPAQGATVPVTLNAPYSGAANQTVWVENQQYLINPAAPPPPSNTLTLINLTDVSVAAYIIPSDVLSVPELPAGRMGAYGMNHVAMSLIDGKSFIYGDVAGGPSGTPANNYRDAVLKTTESDLLVGQGAFRIPNSGEIITSMTFPANLDAALGQGPLQVGTPVSMFSCVVTNVRTEWPTLSGPILPMSLKGKGPLAQDSTGAANSDTIFRSYAGLASLILARRDFTQGWGNTPISREVERVINRDNQSLLSYGSQANFDNRRLDTCSPQVSNQGVFHVGQTAINFDPVSSLGNKSQSVWDGVFTGINVLKFNVGEFDSIERCLPFVFNFTDQKIELWELLKEGTEEYLDNGVTPIVTVFETGVIFHPDKRSREIPLVKLTNGKIYLQKMKGNINVRVLWRPLFYPCWTLWHERDICVQTTGDEIKPGYMTIGLGDPPIDPCDESSGVNLIIGRGHQLRIEISGQYEFMGGDFEASEEKVVKFPPPICDVQDCRVIQCTVPDDLRIYSLSGLPPLPLPNITPGHVGNNPVYYNFPCETGEITYDGTLPSWITIDVPNSRLVGAANTFFGNTLVLANQSAQNALNQFALDAIAATTLNCGGSEPASCNDLNTDQYQISPYSDGDVLNTLGSVLAGGEVLFTGLIVKKSDEILFPCLWMARNLTDPMFEMTGLQFCDVEIQFVTDRWFLTFYDGNTIFPATWAGEKLTGSTPAGIYTRTGGSSAVPATLTVINIGGVAPEELKPNCSSS